MKKEKNIIFPLYMIALWLIQISNFAQNISFFPNKFLYKLIDIAIIILAATTVLTLTKIKLSIKQWIIIFLIISISFFCTVKTNNNYFIQFCLFIISGVTLDFKQVIKKDLKFKIFLLLFIIMCYHLGKVENTVFIRAGILRESFGFNNPNAFGFYIMCMFFEYIYIKDYSFNYKNLIKTIALCIITLYALSFAESRSCEISIVIYIILYIFRFTRRKNENKNINKKNQYLGLIIILLFTVISIYLSKNLNYEFVKSLNKILSGRISIQNYYLSNYKIKLFGQGINYIMSLDNAYLRLLINYGIVGFATFSLILNKMLKESEKQTNLHFIIISLLFYGIMEWFLIRPAINIFLVFFSTIIKIETKKTGEIK